MAYPLFHEAGPRELPSALTPAELAATFPAEDEHVEFSRTLLEPHIRDNVAAFSNTDGGVILLGVRNDGVLLDQGADDESLARIHRTIAEVSDPGRYELHRLAVGDVTLLVIAVRRRREGFAQTPDGRVLVRRDATNTPLLGAELAHFVAAHEAARPDLSAVGPTLDDADPAQLDTVRRAHRWPADQLPERLHTAGLLTAPVAGAPLTVAGALFLLENPGGTLGTGGTQVVRFDADDGGRHQPRELTGPVHQQIDGATRAVLDALGTDSVVVDQHPHELPRLPVVVVREAIANAVAHRSYERGTGSVRVEVHPDRVVVRSPGDLPEPVTLANLSAQAAPRHPAVAAVLRRLDLVDARGHGVDVMADAMAAHLLGAPRFDADGGHVVVELPLASEATPQERAWMAEMSERAELDEADRALLLLAVRGHALANAAVRATLGVDVTRARLALQRLRDRGFLAQSGQLGGAAYVLADGLAPLAGPRLAHRQLQKVVLTMAVKGGVTNEQIRERTGLTRRETLKLLSGLVAEGRLVKRGSRRGTFYTLG